MIQNYTRPVEQNRPARTYRYSPGVYFGPSCLFISAQYDLDKDPNTNSVCSSINPNPAYEIDQED